MTLVKIQVRAIGLNFLFKIGTEFPSSLDYITLGTSYFFSRARSFVGRRPTRLRPTRAAKRGSLFKT